MNPLDLSKDLWTALKAECCCHPETAVRCVMVSEAQLIAALRRISPRDTAGSAPLQD